MIPTPKAAAPVAATMTDDQIKHMVNRFLAWRLPEDFRPDGGIKFTPYINPTTGKPYEGTPTGTNLFDANQAEAMVRFMVEGMSASPAPTTKWASPALDRAYREVEKLRDQMAQSSESGIDEALRAALDAIELADTELGGSAI